MRSENTQKQKIIFILLALFVSVLLWLYVDNFGNNGGPRLWEKEILDIPITYIGESGLADRGLMMLPEGSTETLDVKVTASHLRLSRLEKEDIRAVVDLSKVESAGTQSISCQLSFTNPKKNFSVNMITERSVVNALVNITELNNRTVKVVCELVGNLAEGYSAGQPRLSQETLEIRGQAEDIDPVSYVKVTLDIGENAVDTVSQSLPFQYYSEDGQLLDGSGIHPTVQAIQATLPVYVTKELELTVDFQEYPGLRAANLGRVIRPGTITVSGEAGVLRGINSITLGKLDLMDLYSSDIRRHTFSIIVPEGCENLSGVTRATLELDFQDLITAQVRTDQFTYTNAPAGKHVEILTGYLDVSILGTKADVEAVTGERITVTADLSSYSGASGTYNVPAEVTLNTPGDVGISGTYQLQITIQEMPEDGGEDAEEPPQTEE